MTILNLTLLSNDGGSLKAIVENPRGRVEKLSLKESPKERASIQKAS